MSTLSRADNGFLRVTVAFGAGADKQSGDIDIAGLAAAASSPYTPPDGYQLVCARYKMTAPLLQTGSVAAVGQINVPSGAATIQADIPGDNAYHVGASGSPITGAIDVGINTSPDTFIAGRLVAALVFERLP